MTSKRGIARRREAWLAEFERLVVEGRPDMAGRLDWDTAVFLFNQRLSASDAARRVIIAGRPASPRHPFNGTIKVQR